MASWITSSKVNFKPDSSHTASGWLGVFQDSSTTSNTSVTITGHINLYSTKDPPSWYGTFSSSSTNITSNKGTVTKSLPNKSFTTNRSTKYHNEQIGTFTITIPRGTAAQTATISVSSSITITSSDFSGKSASGTVTGSATVSVPVLQSYAVTYNNNNGTGTTQSQTKYYGVALSLNYTNPSLTNYSFIGWATSEVNAKAGTYSGTYVKGYSYTSNAALTLYGTYALAYSKPIINNLSVERCAPDPDNVGQYLPDDEGTYAIVSFDWSVFTSNSPQYYGGSTYPYSSNAVDSCTVTVGSETATPTLTGTSGSETVVVGSGNFSTDTQYATTVEITDTQTATSPHTTTAGGALPTSSFPIDVNADGTAVAILRPAPDNDSGLFVGSDIEAAGGGVFGDDVSVTGDVTATGDLYAGGKKVRSSTRVWSGVIWPTVSQGGMTWTDDGLWSSVTAVFSAYESGKAQNYAWHCYTVSRSFIAAHPGEGHAILLINSRLALFGTKYVYFFLDHIAGNDHNDDGQYTARGMTAANNNFVIREIWLNY